MKKSEQNQANNNTLKEVKTKVKKLSIKQSGLVTGGRGRPRRWS